jgi:VanZ family protein
LFEYLNKKKVLLVYIPLIVYWLILFTATSIPVEKLPSIGLSDKVNHLMAYFVLSALVYLTLIFQRKSRFLFNYAPVATLIISIFYGIADELHQMLIPGRSAEVLDWAADALGAVLGILLVFFLKNRLKYQPDYAQG